MICSSKSNVDLISLSLLSHLGKSIYCCASGGAPFILVAAIIPKMRQDDHAIEGTFKPAWQHT